MVHTLRTSHRRCVIKANNREKLDGQPCPTSPSLHHDEHDLVITTSVRGVSFTGVDIRLLIDIKRVVARNRASTHLGTEVAIHGVSGLRGTRGKLNEADIQRVW